MHRTARPPRLAAGPGVGIRRDAAPQTPPLALLASLAALPGRRPAADVPSSETLYDDGPSGRFLIDGQWLFRLDAADQGLRQRFYRQTLDGRLERRSRCRTSGTSATTPRRRCAARSAGTARTSSCPTSAPRCEWAVRFESVNYRTRVWLNGREIGRNTGAYIPFQLRLKGLAPQRRQPARGPRRLAPAADRLPALGPERHRQRDRRLVELRRHPARGLPRRSSTRSRSTPCACCPSCRCAPCPATVDFTLALENVTERARRVSATASYGARSVGLGTRTAARGPGGAVRRAACGSPTPRLWSPKRPFLYPVKITVGSRRAHGRHATRSRAACARSRSRDGRLYLNGKPLNIRGVGVHEDNRTQGFAVDNAFRDRLVAEARAVGATMLRTHYPMHPYIHELADRLGLLIWSEIPVYAVQDARTWPQESVRALAAKEMRRNVEANLNHPSVIAVVGRQRAVLEARAGAGRLHPPRGRDREGHRPDAAGRHRVRRLPVGGLPDRVRAARRARRQRVLRLVPGPGGAAVRPHRPVRLPRQRAPLLPAPGDHGHRVRRRGQPRRARSRRRARTSFQQEFVNFHLGVFASKPWLSGAIYWALNEFRVKPDWEGGNPRPRRRCTRRAC